jgi:hypothetical protein
MSLADDILVALVGSPAGLTDAELAQRLDKRHQHVNQVCRQLGAQGQLQRGQHNGTIVNLPLEHTDSDHSPSPRPAPAAMASRSWDWEGNVQAALCRWLSANGRYLVQVADTATRQRGTDVIADRAGQRLHLEVKGYPSKTYPDPLRAHEVKPTQPTLQAKHWYAWALLSAIRLREQYPDDHVAIGLPEAPRYRALVRENQNALRLLRIEIFIVAQDGTVTEMTRGTGDDAA